MTINVTPTIDYIIGLDGGGSKTLALVAGLDGTILGKGTAGSSNPHHHGLTATFTAIESAIQAAQAAAGLRRGSDASLASITRRI